MSNQSVFAGAPLSPGGRVGLLVTSGLLVAGFLLARSLEPDPRGYGTHQKLGLPECVFQLLWNRPCPGCGMTTSFAQLVRGNLAAAAKANPAGVLLGTICAALIPWMWLSVWQGRTVGVDAPLPALLFLVVAVAAVTLGVWGLRFWR